MKDRETPLRLVRLWKVMDPHCYEQLDILAQAKTDGEIWWDDCCMLPINAAFTYLLDALSLSPEQAAGIASELTACWAWRQHKIIYRFDDALAEELIRQVDETYNDDVLPADLLLHLPYPIIYVKSSVIAEGTDGFFFWIDYDVNRNGYEMRLQLVRNGFETSVGLVMHLLPGRTIWDCIYDTYLTSMSNLGEPPLVKVEDARKSAGTFLKALQLVLYLIADNADVAPDMALVRQSDRNGDKKKGTKPIDDTVNEVESYSAGVRIGATIRKARARRSVPDTEPHGGAKRPHSRRGHWHHYWSGPMSGDRKLILKWTAPTFIHQGDAEKADGGDVVIFPVKK